MDMIFEKNRLASFKKWPFNDKHRCNPKSLAEAGFYWVSSDCAKCFVCFKELEGWESEDDPWTEHRQHAKSLNCEFINVGKKESEMTVREFLSICSAHEQKTAAVEGEKRVQEALKIVEKNKTTILMS